MSKTVALFSSSRSNGNTGKLLADVASKINVDIIDLSEHTFSDYDYEYKNQDDEFSSLMDKVLAYENIIFASPIYWYSVTPVMKRFLDRISDLLELPHLLDTGRRLRDKTGFVLCTSASNEISNSYISAFEETFEYLGMYYGGFIHANCDAGYQAENHVEDLSAFTASLKT